MQWAASLFSQSLDNTTATTSDGDDDRVVCSDSEMRTPSHTTEPETEPVQDKGKTETLESELEHILGTARKNKRNTTTRGFVDWGEEAVEWVTNRVGR